MPATASSKELRGTKRVCKACETRFYDLGRDPTVCPSCKSSLPIAQYAPPVERPRGSYSSGWGMRRPPARQIVPDEAEIAAPIEEVVAEDKSEAAPAGEDDAILEQEIGDEDVGDLLSPDESARPEE